MMFIRRKKVSGKKFRACSDRFLQLAGLILVLHGCDLGRDDTAYDRFDAEGKVWLTGDAYVLSSRSANVDSERTPAEIQADAGLHELSFVFIMDHSPSTGSLSAITDPEIGSRCDSLILRPDRVECISNPSLWNLGPELPERAWLDSGLGDAELHPGVQITYADITESALETGLRVMCYVPEAGYENTASVSDHPTTVYAPKDGLEQCRKFSGLPFLVMNSYSVTDSALFHGVMLVNEGMGYQSTLTSAVQFWLSELKRGELPAMLGGSGNRSAGETDDLDSGPGFGSLRSSLFVHPDEDEGLYNALLQRKAVVHSPGVVLEVQVYSFGGSYAGTVGDIFTSDLLEPVVRVRGTASGDSLLFVVGIERGTRDTPGSVRDLRRAAPFCAETCSFDLTYEPIQGDNMAYVHIIAPENFWDNPSAGRTIEEVAIANPVVFR